MLPVRIDHPGSGLTLASHAFLAERWHERAWGWLGKNRVAQGEGLVLQPCASIHTMCMRFSLDLLFLGADNRVGRLVKALGPWKVCWKPGMARVIELPAGTLDRVPVAEGDLIAFAARVP